MRLEIVQVKVFSLLIHEGTIFLSVLKHEAYHLLTEPTLIMFPREDIQIEGINLNTQIHSSLSGFYQKFSLYI